VFELICEEDGNVHSLSSSLSTSGGREREREAELLGG
jgi:hypothetical protein